MSAAGPTAPGVRSSTVRSDTTARHLGYECVDGYYGGMDMTTASHPQTLIAPDRRSPTSEADGGYNPFGGI